MTRRECSHPEREWTLHSTGAAWRAPHPRLRGIEWPMPADDGPMQSRHATPVTREWLTKGASAYPEALNRYLAIKLVKVAEALNRRPKQNDETKLNPEEAEKAPTTEHTSTACARSPRM